MANPQEQVKPQNSGEIVERDKSGKFLPGHEKMGGKKEGSRNFSTIFDEVIEKISKKEGIEITEAESALIKKAYEEAKRGNFNYYRDIMDRKYGKVKERKEIAILDINQLLDDIDSGEQK